MTSFLPLEHLSPTQLHAYLSLESDKSMEVQSSDFMALVDILNLLISDKEFIIACDSHSKRLMEDYQRHHSLVEPKVNDDKLVTQYQKEISELSATYKHSYPDDKDSLIHQYRAILGKHGLNTQDTIELDTGLTAIPYSMMLPSKGLKSILSTHKKTWAKYEDIDPFECHFYDTKDHNSIQKYLEMWASTVKSIRNDLRKGLQQIIETEKYRILSIKKQLTQHLLNYQHHQTQEELNLIKKKIAFILTDLPRSSYKEFTDLVLFALSNWESATSPYLTKYSRRFNSRNHDSIIIREAIQELKVVMRDIENNGYLKLDIANKPLSYETQIIQVEGLLQQLEYCKNWLKEELGYIEWKTFYSSLDSFEKRYINILTSLDETTVDKQLTYIEIQSWKNKIFEIGIPTIGKSIAVFEAYKNVSASINWSKIKLTSESSKADFHMNYNGVNYSLTNTHSAESKLSYVIEDKQLYNIRPMVTLDYYAQSLQANYLTNAVVATNANLRIFQTRSLNIISALDVIDTTQMISLLDTKNINELKGESISELIKGSILNEGKEKIIIVYDELLNTKQIEHYFWQRLVLQSMTSAGFKVISINTSDVLNHMDLSKQFAPYLESKGSPYRV